MTRWTDTESRWTQELRDAHHDATRVLADAAELTESAPLKAEFREAAQRHEAMEAGLASVLAAAGEPPTPRRSPVRAARRWWTRFVHSLLAVGPARLLRHALHVEERVAEDVRLACSECKSARLTPLLRSHDAVLLGVRERLMRRLPRASTQDAA